MSKDLLRGGVPIERYRVRTWKTYTIRNVPNQPPLPLPEIISGQPDGWLKEVAYQTM